MTSLISPIICDVVLQAMHHGIRQRSRYQGSCIVTDKVVTPVFLSTETEIRLLKASAMADSSLVRRKGSSFASPSSGSSLNKDNVHPNTLKERRKLHSTKENAVLLSNKHIKSCLLLLSDP